MSNVNNNTERMKGRLWAGNSDRALNIMGDEAMEPDHTVQSYLTHYWKSDPKRNHY